MSTEVAVHERLDLVEDSSLLGGRMAEDTAQARVHATHLAAVQTPQRLDDLPADVDEPRCPEVGALRLFVALARRSISRHDGNDPELLQCQIELVAASRVLEDRPPHREPSSGTKMVTHLRQPDRGINPV